MTNHERRKQIHKLAALLTISLLALLAANRFDLLSLSSLQAQSTVNAPFSFEEVMIPARDGVRLQTVILAPTDQKAPLPILFRRTPYGVPSASPPQVPTNFKDLVADGYIFVIQNLRGRFKSEGVFKLSSQVNLSDPTSTNETTDAYDSIEWLVKNVRNNNGKVGMYGVSYDGLTSAMALLHPHPALKAISEQASPVDQWMNDDTHRYGALRESYAFEYAVLEQSDKNKNTHFEFDIYDAYSWYLKLGPLTKINDRYLHGSIPNWNDIVAHPDYDDFWKKEAWVRQLHSTSVPLLNVAGFWDQEDPWGPWQIFRHAEERNPDQTNFMVAGPWFHGQWRSPKGEKIGPIMFGGHETAREFREMLEAPFFRYYLHNRGEKPRWKVTTFQSGANRWQNYSTWPPKEAKLTSIYLNVDGSLSFDAPKAGSVSKYREYVSDPASPVPYRQRPISPTYPGGDWTTWEVSDQRFVDGRSDVLTFVSAPLERDLIVTGEVMGEIFASTSGTDSDFVLKLIDAYPENFEKPAWEPESGPPPGDYARSLNGYQLPIAMEIRRGRYLNSFERPQALVPNKPVAWKFPLRDRDHVFLKGHRLMVQVQSSWFPLIDRNPQKFVSTIYGARASDFDKATQRVYCSPPYASRIVLPVMP
jgi:putative CocE/NonD family hydrolase